VSGYCDIASGHPLHGPYHDSEYGFPARDETVLFERLVLEIFQAGLSWLLVLKRRPDFNAAFAGFDVDRIARFGDKDIERLLADPRVIRNRLKIEAIVENARRIKALRQSHGGFADWLDAHHPLSKPEWVKLFKKTFKFTGGEITGEFLMSLGYLPGAHRADCPVMKKIARARSAQNDKPAQSAQKDKPAAKKSPGRKAAKPK
jgi:DNA-3-methyladenine glycosylase I